MKIEYYQDFERLNKLGLRKQATQSLQQFVNSFESENEIQRWVFDFLTRLAFNNNITIHHELFANLVYPVLKKGFNQGDYFSTLWLGKFELNICKMKSAWAELGGLSKIDFYKKCYHLAPERAEARKLLLDSLLNWFSYCEHEWPSGILYGKDGATLVECDEIQSEAELALTLEVNQNELGYIKEFINKLHQYKHKLLRSPP